MQLYEKQKIPHRPKNSKNPIEKL